MFKKIIELIEENDSIVIFGHEFPDGDCIGSQLGLRELIKLNYPDKKVYATGSGFKRFVSLIGDVDQVDDETICNSLAIILDGNDLSRMEDKRVFNCKCYCKLDHHVENGKFTEGPFVVRESANSTCEIIIDLIRENNFKVNYVICTALYLGMLTDTGRFQYCNDFIKTFKDSIWLVENGANPKKIMNMLQESNEYSLSFKGFIYTHYQKTNNIIYCILKKEDLAIFGLTSLKAATMVNLLGNIKGFPAWAFFCEGIDGTYKVELRSIGPAIQPLANKYGGGGHMAAAGATVSDINVVYSIINELDELVKNYKENNMWEKELQEAIAAGELAKKAILEIYSKPFDVEIKDDDSPVTLADKTADKIIKDYLSEKFPTYAFLTEESTDDKSRLNNDLVWIIDPVDGTKDFVAKNGGFTTNIALSYKHEAILGVVIIPVTGEIYYAVKGMGAFYRVNGKDVKIHVNDKTEDLLCLRSVFHSNEKETAIIEKHSDKITRTAKVGSSQKACKIAHGLAEISYRINNGTKEWDTAAFQVIVEQAGGLVVEPDGTRMMYNREDVYNRKGYIIVNRKENILF